jgi:enoyl-CoA hydratase
MDYQYLKLEKQDGVAIVTIHRPDALNALNQGVLHDLFGALLALRDDAEVKVIVLTGTGKAFVAGADIAHMKDLDEAGGAKFAELGHAVFSLVEKLPKPVIAAVNGFALGGGTELALACDLVYASDKAKFGQPEVKLGIIPGFGGTQRLPRLIGRNAAKEWIFTGDIYPAEKALALGLVNEVVPAEQLMARVLEIARKIAAVGPVAVARAKFCINEGQDLALASGLEIEKAAFIALFHTKDRLEGMTAFVEKRPAKFEGR